MKSWSICCTMVWNMSSRLTVLRLTEEGLHFNPAGYQVLLQELLKVIRESVPELAPENVPLLLPLWNDVEAWAMWDAEHE